MFLSQKSKFGRILPQNFFRQKLARCAENWGFWGPRGPKWPKRAKIMFFSISWDPRGIYMWFYTLLVGLWGCRIDWNGLEAPIVTFLDSLGSPAAPVSGQWVGRARLGKFFKKFSEKNFFSNLFKTSKMILKTFLGHNIVFLTQKNPILAVFCPKMT